MGNKYGNQNMKGFTQQKR